jgi:hypothetical protein
MDNSLSQLNYYTCFIDVQHHKVIGCDATICNVVDKTEPLSLKRSLSVSIGPTSSFILRSVSMVVVRDVVQHGMVTTNCLREGPSSISLYFVCQIEPWDYWKIWNKRQSIVESIFDVRLKS